MRAILDNGPRPWRSWLHTGLQSPVKAELGPGSFLGPPPLGAVWCWTHSHPASGCLHSYKMGHSSPIGEWSTEHRTPTVQGPTRRKLQAALQGLALPEPQSLGALGLEECTFLGDICIYFKMINSTQISPSGASRNACENKIALFPSKATFS